VKQHRFRALITFGPAAGHLRGPHALCVVQPILGKHLPAAISCKELRVGPGVRAVVSVTLADGEAQAFFAPSQPFTIWADAVIGHTIRADRVVGHGVIFGPASVPLPPAHGVGAPRPARQHRLAARGAPATRDRGQPVAV
jgi:hypothetical protein